MGIQFILRFVALSSVLIFSVMAWAADSSPSPEPQPDSEKAVDAPANSKKPPELEVYVHGRRSTGVSGAMVNRTELDQQQINSLPGGDQAGLSKVISETTPGSVAGPTGQLFFRGTYESSTQYQLDGVQLPDLATVRFGQIFPTEAVDRFEVLTGAFPAEYGEKLGGVVNIITKSGGIEPSGSAELKLGSYNTVSPSASYGGSLLGGKVHYFASLIYTSTDRVIDTPQPATPTQINRGGEAAIHDRGVSNGEFLKLDWIADNENKLTLLMLNSRRFMQLPNFPGSFLPSDPLFINGDSYGNPAYRYAPPSTNDTQTEDDNYIQALWTHTFSQTAFLQVAPYWKGSVLGVGNDLTNDLVGVQNGQTYSSFNESHLLSSFGLHVDYTQRIQAEHRLKAGLFAQTARTSGSFTVTTATNSPGNTQSYSDSAPVEQNQEAIYLQDDYSPTKQLTVNVGVRENFTQLSLSDQSKPGDSSFQPRVGASYAISEATLVHAYYGRLYHNAPAEDLRVAFNGGSATGLSPYDIKSENADYVEAGLMQHWLTQQVVSVTAYYRSAKNWIDDAQVPNTYISQPINYALGYTGGVDIGFHGPIDSRLSYFLNYSFMQARVKGLTGGIFTQEPVSAGYKNLDTDQAHTVQGGVTWRRPDSWWWSFNGLFGSGLPTSEDASKFLPGHLTFDASVGYEFKWQDWKFRASGDILNILDDPYPITIANGLVATQYSAGREFFVHLGTMF